MTFIGVALIVVLTVVGARFVIQRRMLNKGHLKRCVHCGRPHTQDVIYCPHCGEVVRHGRFLD